MFSVTSEKIAARHDISDFKMEQLADWASQVAPSDPDFQMEMELQRFTVAAQTDTVFNTSSPLRSLL